MPPYRAQCLQFSEKKRTALSKASDVGQMRSKSGISMKSRKNEQTLVRDGSASDGASEGARGPAHARHAQAHDAEQDDDAQVEQVRDAEREASEDADWAEPRGQ